eukprot:TRINITY_DN60246_c0_g1_i1.p1 TRINITY_DN60246_c0_g1~~TRINITY_DN60246_c0_g1_i1.p1  ORF type:complete len:597 (+),score=187.79 TRINITY_DN60246_c0_g1_i1:218-1792(+)
MFTSVFNLLNAILGSGALGLPYVMRSSGIGLFLVIIAVMACLVDFSLQLLLAAALTTNTRNYPKLGYIALGDKGHRFTCCIIMLQNTGGIISYFTVVKDVIGDVMKLIVDEGSIWANANFMTVLISVVLAFPLALSPKVSFLGYAGLLAFAAFVWFFFFVIIKLGVENKHCDDCTMYAFHPTLDTFLAVPTMCFSFVCHTTVLPVAEELEEADRTGRTKRDRRRMVMVIHYSVAIALLIYSTVSLCGYLTFRDNVKKDLLKNYADTDGSNPISIATRLLFTMAVLFGAPLLFFPWRKSLFSLLGINMEPPGDPMTEGLIVEGEKEPDSPYSPELAPPPRRVHSQPALPDGNSPAPPPGKQRTNTLPVRGLLSAGLRQSSSHSVISAMTQDWHLRYETAQRTGGQMWWARHIGVTFSALSVMLAVALCVPHITVVFAAAGSTSSVSLVFILPALIYERTCMDHENLLAVQARGSYMSDGEGALTGDGMPGWLARWGPWGLLRLGVAIGLISWGGLIYNWSTNGFG